MEVAILTTKPLKEGNHACLNSGPVLEGRGRIQRRNYSTRSIYVYSVAHDKVVDDVVECPC